MFDFAGLATVVGFIPLLNTARSANSPVASMEVAQAATEPLLGQSDWVIRVGSAR